MSEVIICQPRTDCMDAHTLRWHCMRGHALPEEDKAATPGVCPLTKCARLGANREPGDAERNHR